MSTRTPTPDRSRCCARSPATAATWWRWATRTSRSTRSAGPRCAASWTSPPSSRAPTARRPRWWRCGRRAGSGRDCYRLPAGCRTARAARHHRPGGAGGLPPAAGGARSARRRARSWCARSTPSGPRPSTSPTCCGAPTSRTACPGTRWRCWSAPGRVSIPPLRRALGAAGVPVEVASDEVPLVRDPAGAAVDRRGARRPQARQRRPRRPSTTSTPPGPRRCSPARSAGSTPATYAASPAACAPAKGAGHGRGPLAAALARAGPPRRRRRGLPRRRPGRPEPRRARRRAAGASATSSLARARALHGC